MRKGLLLVVIFTLVLGIGPGAMAAWPERPVQVIVAYSAGGGTDVLARTIAPFIEKYLGTPVVVINRPGAGGEVGFTALAQAKPDGYTIGFINLPNVLTIPIERDTKYTLDDLEPIANLVDDPGAFNVLPSSPFKTLADLMDYAKKNPGVVTVGTSGVGSDDHIAMLFAEKQAGVDLTHVPFGGAAPNRTALLGGHISLGAFNISEAIQFAEAGKIRVLGQMAEERWELAKDVPTFKEQGYGIVMASQRGFAAPKGVSSERLDKLAEAIGKAVEDPEFKSKAKDTYLPLRYMPRKEYTEFLHGMDARFRDLWESTPWVSK